MKHLYHFLLTRVCVLLCCIVRLAVNSWRLSYLVHGKMPGLGASLCCSWLGMYLLTAHSLHVAHYWMTKHYQPLSYMMQQWKTSRVLCNTHYWHFMPNLWDSQWRPSWFSPETWHREMLEHRLMIPLWVYDPNQIEPLWGSWENRLGYIKTAYSHDTSWQT